MFSFCWMDRCWIDHLCPDVPGIWLGAQEQLNSCTPVLLVPRTATPAWLILGALTADTADSCYTCKASRCTDAGKTFGHHQSQFFCSVTNPKFITETCSTSTDVMHYNLPCTRWFTITVSQCHEFYFIFHAMTITLSSMAASPRHASGHMTGCCLSDFVKNSMQPDTSGWR